MWYRIYFELRVGLFDVIVKSELGSVEMSKSKIFFRDLLGLILILSSVSVTIAVLLDLLAVLTHFSHEDMISATFFHESLPLFLFIIPAIVIAKYINRPEWVDAVKNYRLNAAKNLSERL